MVLFLHWGDSSTLYRDLTCIVAIITLFVCMLNISMMKRIYFVFFQDSAVGIQDDTETTRNSKRWVPFDAILKNMNLSKWRQNQYRSTLRTVFQKLTDWMPFLSVTIVTYIFTFRVAYITILLNFWREKYFFNWFLFYDTSCFYILVLWEI